MSNEQWKKKISRKCAEGAKDAKRKKGEGILVNYHDFLVFYLIIGVFYLVIEG